MLENSSILIIGGTGFFGNAFVPLTLKIYASDTNSQWITDADLQAWMAANHGDIGKI